LDAICPAMLPHAASLPPIQIEKIHRHD
jgi:hypothetical protein